MSSAKKFCLVIFSLIGLTTIVAAKCEHGQHYQNLDDCRKFAYCSNGEMYNLSCSEGFYWNAKKSSCDFQSNVTCPVVIETPKIITGPAGPRGLRGVRGARGLPGPKGDNGRDYQTGILLVKHSQSEDIPSCDAGHIKIWDGYSLLYVDVDDYSHNQDLGSTGSCVRRFSTQPVLVCGLNNVCNYASRSDRSFWLSTSAAIPMMPVQDEDIRQYISRCVVCEVPSNVIAVHSQSIAIPDCPTGWESLWIGYSFLMHASVANGGGGQALSGTGSCLEDFRVTPFIECNGGRGHCHYYDTQSSVWLATLTDSQQFTRPEQQTLKAGNLLARVSRCNVCIRK